MHSGDIVLMYTDGLAEARNSLNEEFGQERIKSLLENHQLKSSSEFLSILKDEVKMFSKGSSHDDLTLIVLKRK